MSNYHSFGDLKFVPEMEPDVFRAILTSHPDFSDQDSLIFKIYEEVYPKVEAEIFAYDAPYTQLNFPSEGGVTAYFSRNMTTEDLALVKAFLA